MLLLPTTGVILFTWRWQAVSLVLLAVHMILVEQAGAACFALLLLSLLATARHDSLAALVMYVQILLYQNVMISVFSVGIERSDYTILSGTAFAASLVLALVPAWRAMRTGRPFRFAGRPAGRVAIAVAAALAVALAYTVLGTASAGATAAAVGFRNATSMLLAIVIGLEAGDRWGYRTVATTIALSMLPGLLLACAEIADPGWYLSLIHAADFSNAKYASDALAPYYTADDVISRATQLPFNTDLLAGIFPNASYRFGGPNMHSISYGYVLAVTELLLLSLGWGVLAIPLLALSLLAGVKGAAILVTATMLLYLGWSMTGSRKALAVAGLLFTLVYVGFGIESGLSHGDFHVIGFLGGVNGFLKDPLGHGLGVGGNLGLGTLSVAKWQEFQHDGADVGLESAIGVLLYQMGVGAAAIAAAIVMLFRAAPFGASGRPQATEIVFIGLGVALVNGVFQEEAYSPYAAGLLCLLCGVLAANGRRPAVVARA